MKKQKDRKKGQGKDWDQKKDVSKNQNIVVKYTRRTGKGGNID